MPRKEEYKGYSANRKYQARYMAKKQVVLNALKSVPCSDCGVRYPPYVMDFDHLKPEEKEIKIGQGWSITRTLAEIEKCEVVCSNCHRIREHERRQMKKMPRKKHPKRTTISLMSKRGVGRWVS